MKGNIQVARLLGIPLVINVSWFLTLFFVTTMLAVRLYPEVFPPGSAYRNDQAVHWIMALVSGLTFFASIVLHELAHSIVARHQGLSVQNITLFVFGGVSQIGGEARRPLHEFVMAIIGPLTSLALAGIFFGLWWIAGHTDEEPITIVLEWLFFMNLVVAAFNMAPGFPMDGGRVLRSLLWGISGNLYRSTRLATILGRVMGYGLMVFGGLAFFGVFTFVASFSGLWFVILGLFLETSARQSWTQARAFNMLSAYKAADVMSSDLDTARQDDRLHQLVNHDNRRFIYFVSDADDQVVGVLTEKEVSEAGVKGRMTAEVGDVMQPRGAVAVAQPEDDGAKLLQDMEAAGVWHLPVVSEGRVIGVVGKENLLRLIARGLFPERRPRPL